MHAAAGVKAGATLARINSADPFKKTKNGGRATFSAAGQFVRVSPLNPSAVQATRPCLQVAVSCGLNCGCWGDRLGKNSLYTA